MSAEVSKVQSVDVARRAQDPILAIGATFGGSPEFARLAREFGLEAWPVYFAGRGGMLGPVGAEVVSAAFGFFAPSLVASAWSEASRVAAPSLIAATDATAFASWGRRVLGGIPGVDRTAALAERVVNAADSTALPLFAAWRAFTNPDEHPGARAALALNRLREHRGGLHLLAVRAAGLSPLEAILASGGEDKARANGWRDPFPDVTDLIPVRVAAEAHTNELVGRAYAALDTSEAEEFVRGLARVREQLQAPLAG